MKLFLDTAQIADIKRFADTGILDGVTTNPTHLSAAGGNPVAVIQEIINLIPHGEISVEVTETDPAAVYEQAKKLADLGENIIVKIPCHEKYYPVIQQLVTEGVTLNITLVFTLIQSLMMCKLNVKYISPFVGRWNDMDIDGIELLYEIRMMIDDYCYDTELLAASIRSVRDLHDAIAAGADVTTVPASVLEKSLNHPLTESGMAKFNEDWKKLGIKQFP